MNRDAGRLFRVWNVLHDGAGNVTAVSPSLGFTGYMSHPVETAGWPLRQCPLHLKQTVLALTEHFNMKRSANLDDEARSFLDAMLGGSRLNVIA